MTKNVVDLEEYRKPFRAAEAEDLLMFIHSLPLALTKDHCAEARSMLGWSVEALAFRSGVSVQAIRQFESGKRTLLRVTIQALSYSLEAQGLMFLPGHGPLKCDNARGATQDPRTRDDFHLLE